jgi:uncharacterized protein DUF6893
MNKLLLTGAALLGAIGFLVKSQAPEIQRYRKIRKM